MLPLYIDNYVFRYIRTYYARLVNQLSCVFLSVFQQRIEVKKLRDGDHLILGFSIGGGMDQDSNQNPFSEDKADKVKNHVQ